MGDKDRHEREPQGLVAEVRAVVAEFVGAFALTFVAAGGDVVAALSGGEVGPAARAVAPGLVVLALIYALGQESGAHYNPAVTLAFALRRDFPAWRVPGYWVAQFGGAVVAATILGALFGDVAHLGASQPRFGVVPALVMEVILTFFLVTVILGTATHYRLIGPSAALAVGATIALDGLFAAPVSGASMNPARSLGPALVGGALDHAWVYLAGPAGGAILAVILAWLLHGGRRSGEQEAAKGKDQQ